MMLNTASHLLSVSEMYRSEVVSTRGSAMSFKRLIASRDACRRFSSTKVEGGVGSTSIVCNGTNV